MKKAYLDPEFEFVNIRLVANVIGDSSVDESKVPIDGTTPDEDFGDMDW